MKHPTLTGKGLFRIRRKLGMTEDRFSLLIRIGDVRTIRRYEKGERAVPPPVAVLAQLALEFPEVLDRLMKTPRGDKL